MSTNRPFLLTYDIPQTNGIPVCDNPSPVLWGVGAVRITYSDWVVMEDTMSGAAWNLEIDRLRRAGVRFRTIPFDASAVAELREMALENIRREIQGYRDRADETRREAEAAFSDESNTDYKRRRRAYLAAVRQLECKVAEILRKIGKAAEGFGISDREIRASEYAADLDTATATMKARAAAFAQAHSILTRRSRENDEVRGMASALRSDAVPIAVASDFLREIGEDDAADAINASWGL